MRRRPHDCGAHDAEADYRPMGADPDDPSRGKVEWHLTYACDLDCSGCNRASFLSKPHTEPMTLDDAREFIRQADALRWHPYVVVIGGEPTLHHDFPAFVELAERWSGEAVQIFSNGHAPRTRSKLNQIRVTNEASITAETFKPDGSVRSGTRPEWMDDVFVSPADFGDPLRAACYQHSAISCGVSVDHEGYAPCAMGGMIAALVAPEARTRRLADLFDAVKVAEMTRAMCKHCGHAHARGVGSVPAETFQARVAAAPKLFDTPMSPTWIEAFKGRR